MNDDLTLKDLTKQFREKIGFIEKAEGKKIEIGTVSKQLQQRVEKLSALIQNEQNYPHKDLKDTNYYVLLEEIENEFTAILSSMLVIADRYGIDLRKTQQDLLAEVDKYIKASNS